MLEKRPLKIIAIVVALCFTTTSTVLPNVDIRSSASNPLVQGEVKPALEGVRGILEKISISKEFGKVEAILPADSLNGMESPAIIHIRNAHGSYEAQIRIKQIIDELIRTYDIDTILLEGAAGELEPELFRFFEDDGLNLRIADDLAKVGELTGAELYLLEKSKLVPAVVGVGVENKKAYVRNLEVFRKVLESKTVSETFVRKIRSKIETLGSRVFNKSLRDFVKTWQAWREDALDLSGYLSALRQVARHTLQIDLAHAKSQMDYPILVRFFKAKDLEPKLNFELAKSERTKLLLFLESKKINPAIGKVLQEWEIEKQMAGWKDGKLPRSFVEALYEQAEPSGFRFEDFPNLTKVWASLIFQSELEGEKLFQEIEKLNQLIFGKLAVTDGEKKLVGLIHDSILLEKLLHLELTRRETEDVQRRPGELLPTAEVRRLVGHHGTFKMPAASVRRMDRTYRLANDFYHGAIDRETYLIQNTKNILKERGRTKAILITGGYHSEGLKELFQKSHFSYVEIMPRMTSVDGVQKNYLEAMLETRKTIFDLAQIEHPLAMSARLFPSEQPAMIKNVFDVILKNLPNVDDPSLLVDQFNQHPFAKTFRCALRWAKDQNDTSYLEAVWQGHSVGFVVVENGKIDLSRVIRGDDAILGRKEAGLTSSSQPSQLPNLLRVLGGVSSQSQLTKPTLSRAEALGIQPAERPRSELRSGITPVSSVSSGGLSAGWYYHREPQQRLPGEVKRRSGNQEETSGEEAQLTEDIVDISEAAREWEARNRAELRSDFFYDAKVVAIGLGSTFLLYLIGQVVASIGQIMIIFFGLSLTGILSFIAAYGDSYLRELRENEARQGVKPLLWESIQRPAQSRSELRSELDRLAGALQIPQDQRVIITNPHGLTAPHYSNEIRWLIAPAEIFSSRQHRVPRNRRIHRLDLIEALILGGRITIVGRSPEEVKEKADYLVFQTELPAGDFERHPADRPFRYPDGGKEPLINSKRFFSWTKFPFTRYYTTVEKWSRKPEEGEISHIMLDSEGNVIKEPRIPRVNGKDGVFNELIEREFRIVRELNPDGTQPGLPVLIDDQLGLSSDGKGRKQLKIGRVDTVTNPSLQDSEYFRQVAKVLDDAHAKGFVHNDVKPSNILVTKDGVVVLDWGISFNVSEDMTKPVEGSAITQEDWEQIFGLSGIVTTLNRYRIENGYMASAMGRRVTLPRGPLRDFVGALLLVMDVANGKVRGVGSDFEFMKEMQSRAREMIEALLAGKLAIKDRNRPMQEFVNLIDESQRAAEARGNARAELKKKIDREEIMRSLALNLAIFGPALFYNTVATHPFAAKMVFLGLAASAFVYGVWSVSYRISEFLVEKFFGESIGTGTSFQVVVQERTVPDKTLSFEAVTTQPKPLNELADHLEVPRDRIIRTLEELDQKEAVQGKLIVPINLFVPLIKNPTGEKAKRFVSALSRALAVGSQVVIVGRTREGVRKAVQKLVNFPSDSPLFHLSKRIWVPRFGFPERDFFYARIERIAAQPSVAVVSPARSELREMTERLFDIGSKLSEIEKMIKEQREQFFRATGESGVFVARRKKVIAIGEDDYRNFIESLGDLIEAFSSYRSSPGATNLSFVIRDVANRQLTILSKYKQGNKSVGEVYETYEKIISMLGELEKNVWEVLNQFGMGDVERRLERLKGYDSLDQRGVLELEGIRFVKNVESSPDEEFQQILERLEQGNKAFRPSDSAEANWKEARGHYHAALAILEREPERFFYRWVKGLEKNRRKDKAAVLAEINIAQLYLRAIDSLFSVWGERKVEVVREGPEAKEVSVDFRQAYFYLKRAKAQLQLRPKSGIEVVFETVQDEFIRLLLERLHGSGKRLREFVIPLSQDELEASDYFQVLLSCPPGLTSWSARHDGVLQKLWGLPEERRKAKDEFRFLLTQYRLNMQRPGSRDDRKWYQQASARTEIIFFHLLPLVFRQATPRRSELRFSNERLGLAVAEQVTQFVAAGSNRFERLLAQRAEAAEPPLERSYAPSSEVGIATGLFYVAQLRSLLGETRESVSRVTLKGDSQLVQLLLSLLRDQKVVEGLEERLEIGVSDTDSTNPVRSALTRIINSYQDPIAKAIVGRIISESVRVSGQPFEVVAKARKGAAAFVENEGELEQMIQLQDVFVAFANWSKVKDKSAVREMLVPVLIAAGKLAKAMQTKDISAQQLLVSQLRELGFIFNAAGNRRMVTILLDVVESIYDGFKVRKELAKSA